VSIYEKKACARPRSAPRLIELSAFLPRGGGGGGGVGGVAADGEMEEVAAMFLLSPD
jgi:hypothetical protein